MNGFPTSAPAQLVEYTFAAAQGPPLNPSLGIARDVASFRSALAAFTTGGTLWPYMPACCTTRNPVIPLPTPPAGGQPYPQPQLSSIEAV